MDKLHRHRPFADSGGDTLYRARTHVASGKHPGPASLEQNGWRLAVQCGDSAKLNPVRTNALSSFSISAGSQSVRGTAPMKLNNPGSVYFPRFSGCVVDELDRTQVVVAEHTAHLGIQRTSIFGVCSMRQAR